MKKHVLIALCAIITNFATATDTIEVMSYNVRRKGDDPQEFQWDNRKEPVFEQVLSKEPAVIGFQEVVKGQQFEDLKMGLPGYASFGTPRSEKSTSWLQWAVMKHPRAKDECNPIFYDTKQVNLIKSASFGINPTAILFSDWLPRVCEIGLFQDINTKDEFYIYNAHLTNSSSTIRNKQMLMILDHIAKNTNNLPVILMGDLNTKIEGDIKENLKEALFNHAKEKAPVVKGPQETRTGWHDKELKEIDHILVKNADVKEYEVIKSPEGVYPSDHRPIAAKIVLQ
jgi:endonuclease/exonuclease/phosphatase family metal-dependent hydrolase